MRLTTTDVPYFAEERREKKPKPKTETLANISSSPPFLVQEKKRADGSSSARAPWTWTTQGLCEWRIFNVALFVLRTVFLRRPLAFTG